MSAEEREQERGAPPAPSAAGVSMRTLLASCAAADAVSKPPSDAVSKPPSDGDESAGPSGSTSGAAGAVGESGTGSRGAGSRRQPTRDAA
ncbi:hypothetical protein ACFPA8_00670 [Streptomyces ovatisporus]|uniref:Uncharacterized protein n=1 Tax=Streptomyces ovatisporus TaxID=1128682 RepID=A0ABV9A2B1_9ACTN